MTRIRHRDETDIGMCAEALWSVHQASGYPTNWPTDPARWLQPSRTFRAWVAATDDVPVAGFRLVSTTQADWAAPDGHPVTLHRYAWSRHYDR
jgi:hypothetical protein